MNRHLMTIGMGYFQHLFHAWTMALALIIHGVFPSVLTNYASDKMCDHE
jgi:hypothetical protein